MAVLEAGVADTGDGRPVLDRLRAALPRGNEALNTEALHTMGAKTQAEQRTGNKAARDMDKQV